MANDQTPVAFPTWRDLWVSHDNVAQLLAGADSVLQRRASGDRRMPAWDDALLRGTDTALSFQALRFWADGQPPEWGDTRLATAESIYADIKPALMVAAIPRWLLLERAFLDSSETGDLLFAALTLRTMCEEIQRLRAIDLDDKEIRRLAGSDANADAKRLQLFMSVAAAMLDRLSQETVLRGSGWPRMSLMKKDAPGLERARQALNGYVHPNYGSHIAALYPERTAGARLLLEAVIAVYNVFFSLSWAERPIEASTLPDDVRAPQTWEETGREYSYITLPELRDSVDGPLAEALAQLSGIDEWLEHDQNDQDAELLGDLDAPLFRGLPSAPLDNLDHIPTWRSVTMWSGARPRDIVQFAIARRAERQLADQFPDGAPETTHQEAWLRFNSSALLLSVLLDQVKAAAFKTQLLRQVVHGNGIAIHLCVRSLIEHRALATWLPTRMDAILDELSQRLKAGEPLPPEANSLQKPLAEFLSVNVEASGEKSRAWVISEIANRRVTSLRLSNVVDSAFDDDDRFKNLYDLTSAIMHGRSLRGVELASNLDAATSRSRIIGLLVLDRLCDREDQFAHLALSLPTYSQLKHAADFGGSLAASTDKVAQQVFGHLDDALEAGLDFFGDGSKHDPYVLADHLQYPKDSYFLLRQLGVDTENSTRNIARDDKGNLCDRWSAGDRDYWFRKRLMA